MKEKNIGWIEWVLQKFISFSYSFCRGGINFWSYCGYNFKFLSFNFRIYDRLRVYYFIYLYNWSKRSNILSSIFIRRDKGHLPVADFKSIIRVWYLTNHQSEFSKATELTSQPDKTPAEKYSFFDKTCHQNFNLCDIIYIYIYTL